MLLFFINLQVSANTYADKFYLRNMRFHIPLYKEVIRQVIAQHELSI